MKTKLTTLLIIGTAILLTSCLKDEGKGGTGTIEGYLFACQHDDDNFLLTTDTLPAAKTDTYIIYGNNTYFGDDVETDGNGFYQFKYLRKGDYTIFSYSTLANGSRVMEMQKVSVKNGKTTICPNIVIHTGKANGTSIVTGKVWATYIDKNGNFIRSDWAYEHRVYIMKKGDTFNFDDVRVGDNGVFAFQKLQRGTYIVSTTTTDENQIPSLVKQEVTINNAGEIVEIPQFNVIIRP